MTEGRALYQSSGTRAFALVAAGAVLTSALPARAAEPVSVPADAFAAADAPRTRPDPIAVRGGLLLFGVAYAPMLGVAAAQGTEASRGWWHAAPVAGPFIALPQEVVEPWALVADGVLQTVGVGIVVAGFAHPRRNLGPAVSDATLRPIVAASRRSGFVGVGGAF